MDLDTVNKMILRQLVYIKELSFIIIISITNISI